MDNAETPEFREVSSETAESPAAEIAATTPTKGKRHHKLLTKPRAVIMAIAACVVACLAALPWRSSLFQGEPPVEMRLAGSATDGRSRTYLFRMRLSNRGEKPLWFLLPRSLNYPLPKQTSFPHQGDSEMVFVPMVFYGERGMAAIGVSFFSSTLTAKAFRLPPRTVLEIREYSIPSWGTPRELDVLQSQDLLVNGKIPLEERLPVRVGVYREEELSRGSLRSPMGAHGGEHIIISHVLEQLSESVKQKGRAGVRSEKVEFIEAQGARRWTVKIQPKDETEDKPNPARDEARR